MHEISMARAILDQVRENCPPDGVVREVSVRVGPMQWIEPEALQAGWAAVTRETDLEGTILRVEQVPWTIHCEECQRTYASRRMDEACACGSDRIRPEGSDEITILSLEVDDESS